MWTNFNIVTAGEARINSTIMLEIYCCTTMTTSSVHIYNLCITKVTELLNIKYDIKVVPKKLQLVIAHSMYIQVHFCIMK